MRLFESMNIRPMDDSTLTTLANSQNGVSPDVVLEDGSIAFNKTTGHLVMWNATSKSWGVIPGTDGYTILDSGFWMRKADLSGPYVFDGTTMKLASHV
jgi:hypothetical protein